MTTHLEVLDAALEALGELPTADYLRLIASPEGWYTRAEAAGEAGQRIGMAESCPECSLPMVRGALTLHPLTGRPACVCGTARLHDEQTVLAAFGLESLADVLGFETSPNGDRERSD